MEKINRCLKDFICIVAISLGAIILSEGILRIIFPDRVLNSSLFDTVAFEFNENYLISLKPNISKEFHRKEENGDYITRWKTNNDGFRGPGLKESPKYRVIVYGDSNIHARFSGQKRTFPGQLSRFLQEGGVPDVEVINAGVVGFGPDQMLIRFSNEVDKYKPNLVIFHIFADNDFGDIIRNRLFNLDVNGKLTRTGYKTKVDEHLLSSKQSNQRAFFSNLLVVRAFKKAGISLINSISGEEQKGMSRQSEMQPENNKERIVQELLKITEEEYLVYKENQPRKYSHFTDHYDIDVALYPDQESSKTKIRLMQEVLKEASDLASRKGVSMLVVIQPSVIDLTKDNAILDYTYLQQYPGYKRTNLTDAVEKICTLHGIQSINLYNVFLKNNPRDLFFRRDDHWTDRGQLIAAQEAAQYIINHSMIKNQ